MNSAAPLPAGSRLHDYEVQRLLSDEGSFALVYVAADLNVTRLARRTEQVRRRVEQWRRANLFPLWGDDQPSSPSAGPQVVVKEFIPSELAQRAPDGRTVQPRSGKSRVYDWSRTRFVEEARFLMSHSHPHVVSVFDIVSDNNTDYMVMELLTGGSLMDLAEKGGGTTERQVRRWLLPVLRALQSIEARGVNHLDLSPSNIAFRAAGGDPVLLDFGAARFQARGRSRGTRLIVNDGYSAPEKYRATSQGLDARADVYALGGVVNHVLTGERPHPAMERVADPARARGFTAQSAALRTRRATPTFLTAVDACFALGPDARPANAAAVEALFSPWEARRDAPAQPVIAGGAWTPRRRGVASFLARLILLLLLLLAGPGLAAPAGSISNTRTHDGR